MVCCVTDILKDKQDVTLDTRHWAEYLVLGSSALDGGIGCWWELSCFNMWSPPVDTGLRVCFQWVGNAVAVWFQGWEDVLLGHTCSWHCQGHMERCVKELSFMWPSLSSRSLSQEKKCRVEEFFRVCSRAGQELREQKGVQRGWRQAVHIPKPPGSTPGWTPTWLT